MNAHTKKLFDQALDQAVPETWTTLSYQQITKLSEVFAQLLVQECIAQAVKEEERYDSMAGRDCEYCSMAMANFQGVLAEHFGVEE